MLNEKYVETYTRWINSPTTKEILLVAQGALMNEVHSIDDSTIIGAAKGHYMRCGGEVILNFLATQMTVDQLEAAKTHDDVPDYGADDIMNADLFIEGR